MKKKRLCSGIISILCALMLVAQTPLAVFADEEFIPDAPAEELIEEVVEENSDEAVLLGVYEEEPEITEEAPEEIEEAQEIPEESGDDSDLLGASDTWHGATLTLEDGVLAITGTLDSSDEEDNISEYYGESTADTITSIVCDCQLVGYVDYLFADLVNLESFSTGSSFDSSQMSSMSSFFQGCESLESVDLSSFDTAGVNDMGYMFADCYSLSSIGLSALDTENVTIMDGFLSNCTSLTSADLSVLDTSSSPSTRYMFAGDTELVSADVSGFHTGSALAMFSGCLKLTDIDLTNFNVTASESMSNMFANCVALSTLDLSSLNTSNIVNMSSTFYNCRSLAKLDISSFNTGLLRNWTGMFSECSSLIELKTGRYFVSAVPLPRTMFVADWDETPEYYESNPTTTNETTSGKKFYYVKYPITYNLDGGTATGNLNFYTDMSSFTLNNPTREHFTFAGWTGTGLSEPTMEVSVPVGTTGALEYTANWNVISSNITYDLHGGSAVNPTEYNFYSDPITLNNPVLENYDFAGWTGTGLSEQTMNVTIPTGSTGDRAYEAHYTPTVFNITYNMAGGTTSPANPSTYTIESGNITLNNPTKPYATFTGWIGTGISVPTMEVTICTGTYGDLEFTATWDMEVFEIDYSLAGGTVATPNPSTYTYETPTFVLNNPTKDYYEFTGWTGRGLSQRTVYVSVPVYSFGNRTYEAHWSPIIYDISYDLAGGAVAGTNPTGYSVESDTFTLVNPVKSHCAFLGWTGTGLTEPTTEVTIENGSHGDLDFTANWAIESYNITYNLGGGTVSTPNPDTYDYETATFTLNNPTREHYNFVGWTGTGLDVPTTVVTIPKHSDGNRTYTAVWAPVNYDIVYDLAGGRVTTSNPATYNIETNTFVLNNPVRDHFEFIGWTGTGLTGPTTEVTIEKGSVGSRAYTANWDLDAYHIDYDLAGGTVETPNPTRYNYETATFTLNNPTRDYYQFLGWTGTGLTTPTLTVTIPAGSEGSRAYAAVWTPVLYDISYDLAGGSVTPANRSSYSVETDDFTLRNPVKPHYEFNGWTGTGLTVASKEVTIVRGTHGARSYTATWGLADYFIDYDLNGGSVASANPITYNYETASFTLNNPTKDYYRFVGWTGTGLTEPSRLVTIPTNSEGNRSYTANWELIDYDISYNLNGGSVSSANKVMYTYETETFTLNNPTKDYYSFAGWTGTDLTEPTMEVSIPQGSHGNREYAATWDITEYPIEYDLAGGTVTRPNPSSYTVETATFTLNNPTRDNYIFKGWTGTGLAEPTMDVVVSKGSHEAKAYTATWEAVQYRIDYLNLNGGTVEEPNPVSFNTESEPITLNNPTRENYAFLGWIGTDITTPTATVTIPTGSSGDRVYMAIWDLENYNITYDLAGGSLNGYNPTMYSGEMEAFTLNNPTKDGYDFLGWTGTDLTVATKTVTIETGSSGDREYTATWGLQPYYITYELNGGTATNPTVYTEDMPSFTLVNPTKEHYDFAGWIGTGLEEPTMEVTIAEHSTGDRTYTALWTPTEYDITYVLNGGAAVNPAKYTIETDTFTLNNPTKDYCVFDGWTGTGLTEPSREVVIEKGTTGAREYTAVFTANQYTTTYDLAGGEWSDANRPRPESYTVETPGWDTIVDARPVRANYDFVGWIGANGTTPETVIAHDLFDNKPHNREYLAVWKPTNYILTFHSNNTDELTVEVPYNIESSPDGIEVIGRPATFVKSGFAFAGWNTKEDGSGDTYKPGVMYNTFANASLYAIWSPLPQIPMLTYSEESGSTLPAGTMIEITSTVEDVAIYYTTDGKYPTDQSALYEGPIMLSKPVVLKAIAVKEGYVDSEAAVAEYDVEYKDFYVEPIPAVTYTGTAHKPVITVYDNGMLLTLNKDYSVSYKFNVAAGTGNVIVAGKGNYAQKMTVPFTIKPMTLGDGEDFDPAIGVTIKDMKYTGKTLFSKPVLTYGKVKLKEKTDYTLAYSTDTINPGTVNVTVTATNKNFVGGAKFSYRIYPKEAIQLNKAVVKLDQATSLIYSGEPIRPAVTVYENSKSTVPLVLGQDYEVSYSNNINAGNKAAVTVRGLGKYADAKIQTFAIVPKDIAKLATVDLEDPTYTGKKLAPPVTVKLGDETLPATAYTVTYKNNTNAATSTAVNAKGASIAPTAVIKFKGNYSGTINKTFNILPKPVDGSELTFSMADIKLKDSDAEVTGKMLKPTVKYGKIALKNGKDYTIDFAKVAGIIQTASVRLTGNYANTEDVAQTVFSIYVDASDLTGYTFSIPENTYTFTGKAITPHVTVTTTVDGRPYTLVEGKDYTTTYANNINVASLTDKKVPTWTVKGKGAFSGTKSGQFTITAADLDDTFTVMITDVLIGKKETVPKVTIKNPAGVVMKVNKDYTFTNDSTLTPNDAARMTITGVGNYKNSTVRIFRVYEKAITAAFFDKVPAKYYSGKPIYPSGDDVKVYTAKKNGTRLVENVDYVLTYGENIKKGSGTIYVTGIGKYGGTKQVKFVIAPKWMEEFHFFPFLPF